MSVRPPTNTDLQRQILSLKEDTRAEHLEVKAELIKLSDKFDELRPLIAAQEARLEACETGQKDLRGQAMWAIGIISTAILGLAAWMLSHISGAKT